MGRGPEWRLRGRPPVLRRPWSRVLRSHGNSFLSFLLQKVLVVCPPWQRSPLPRRTIALPGGGLALSRVCRQGRGVGVHRSSAQILDGRSARSQRRFQQEGKRRSPRPVTWTNPIALEPP